MEELNLQAPKTADGWDKVTVALLALRLTYPTAGFGQRAFRVEETLMRSGDAYRLAKLVERLLALF